MWYLLLMLVIFILYLRTKIFFFLLLDLVLYILLYHLSFNVELANAVLVSLTKRFFWNLKFLIQKLLKFLSLNLIVHHAAAYPMGESAYIFVLFLIYIYFTLLLIIYIICNKIIKGHIYTDLVLCVLLFIIFFIMLNSLFG